MRAICVDDEELVLQLTVSICRELPQLTDVKGFSEPQEALRQADRCPPDIALLDIDMPGMTGIELAMKLKEQNPNIAIIFLTGYSQYAVDAFKVRASGYLLKPITKEMLMADVDYALSERRKNLTSHVVIKTFGNFDVFVDGEPVRFKMARCKELLAYLVDRQGSTVTRAEAFSILWEDRPYDRPMQKQFDVVLRSMRTTLREYGIEDIFELQKGTLRICPERFTCDAYLFFNGDADIVNTYYGEYMNTYSWASMTESFMTWKSGKNII